MLLTTASATPYSRPHFSVSPVQLCACADPFCRIGCPPFYRPTCLAPSQPCSSTQQIASTPAQALTSRPRRQQQELNPRGYSIYTISSCCSRAPTTIPPLYPGRISSRGFEDGGRRPTALQCGGPAQPASRQCHPRHSGEETRARDRFHHPYHGRWNSGEHPRASLQRYKTVALFCPCPTSTPPPLRGPSAASWGVCSLFPVRLLWLTIYFCRCASPCDIHSQRRAILRG